MSDNPRAVTPNTDPKLGEACSPLSSLYETMGSVADDMRQIRVDLGGRPYQVYTVVIAWSGGEEGRGRQKVIRETPFLPTPRVRDLAQITSRPTEVGAAERGDAVLDEISPRYTEEDIAKFFPEDLPAGQRYFIEVRMDSRDGPNVPRRRFTPRGVPMRRIERFDWTVRLAKQDSDRGPRGELR